MFWKILNFHTETTQPWNFLMESISSASFAWILKFWCRLKFSFSSLLASSLSKILRFFKLSLCSTRLLMLNRRSSNYYVARCVQHNVAQFRSFQLDWHVQEIFFPFFILRLLHQSTERTASTRNFKLFYSLLCLRFVVNWISSIFPPLECLNIRCR